MAGLASLVSRAPAWAQTAEAYRVVNVEPGDALNIRAGPSGEYPALGAAPQGARGLQALSLFIEGWCPVRFGSVTGWSSAFYLAADTLVAVEPETTESPPEAAAPAREGALIGGAAAEIADAVVDPGAEVSRHVLPDGTLEIRYPDGRKGRRLPNGRRVEVLPDGMLIATAYTQVPGADFPPLPPDAEQWGDQVNARLLAMLEDLLSEEDIQYLRATDAGRTLSEVTYLRLDSLDYYIDGGL